MDLPASFAANAFDNNAEVVSGNITAAALTEIREANQYGRLERFQLRGLAGIALLNEPKPVAQDFACVLVPARPDQLCDDVLVVVGEHDIACGHGDASFRSTSLFPKCHHWHNRPRRILRIGVSCPMGLDASGSTRLIPPDADAPHANGGKQG